MKRTIIISILIFNAISMAAIRPSKAYSYTPDKLDLTFEEIKVKTEDGASINVWHLPPESEGAPVIISQSDTGNMSDWLYLGLYLQAYGLDVWLYDYRGFGRSDDFAIVQDQLFHTEFIKDLDAVAGHVYRKTGKSPALLGISMGTIIVNEYLQNAGIPVSKVIFDGYVADPKAWNEKLATDGKTITLPKGYRNRKYRQQNQDVLFIVSDKDAYSTLADIPKAGKGRQVIKRFDCGHISGFFRYPDEYTAAVVEFIDQIPQSADAEEPQIIGGYLLDGKDSFEELEAAVLTGSQSKEKKLEGKGMKMLGACMMMTPRSIGKEIGSIVQTRHPFLVKTISFTVDENRMEGCKADIRIYRIHAEADLENIVTMPIYQEIPKADKKTTFSIAPEESILLEPGEYFISFSLTEIAGDIMERWADSDTWSKDEHFSRYKQDRIFFPAYLKKSYNREGPDRPLARWGANIGIEVIGTERKMPLR